MFAENAPVHAAREYARCDLPEKARTCRSAVSDNQIRHPVHRLAEHAAGLTGGDDVIDRWWIGFAGHLPDEASDIRIRERWPEPMSARTREPVHRRALEWMLELVRVERIDVEHPALHRDVIPGALECHIVDLDAVFGRIRIDRARDEVVHREEAKDLIPSAARVRSRRATSADRAVRRVAGHRVGDCGIANHSGVLRKRAARHGDGEQRADERSACDICHSP